MLKAITFDLDMTLIDFMKAIKLLHVRSEDAMHVGDWLERDLLEVVNK